MKLILASASPRRKKILKEWGFDFEIIPSNIDEELYLKLDPVEMVETLSKLKAEKIARSVKDALILAADTTAYVGGEILAKPSSKQDAKDMLKKLSGSTHLAITGFTVIDSRSNKSITKSESTRVTFRELTDEEIEAYIDNNDVMDKAGSYAIQEGAGGFVNKIDGDYLNIVGLPSQAREVLKSFGI